MTFERSEPKLAAAFIASVLIAVASIVLSNPSKAADDAAAWAALKSGQAFALMRHALAPGTGDPQTVVIGDCTTQRNLSDSGRDQARRIGARLRKRGITSARVMTSQWCRCRETAQLLQIGAVEDLPALNSFFRKRERADQQTADVRAWLREQRKGQPIVLVTHQVNVSALVGQFTRSGEMLIVTTDADGSFSVIASITTPVTR